MPEYNLRDNQKEFLKFFVKEIDEESLDDNFFICWLPDFKRAVILEHKTGSTISFKNSLPEIKPGILDVLEREGFIKIEKEFNEPVQKPGREKPQKKEFGRSCTFLPLAFEAVKSNFKKTAPNAPKEKMASTYKTYIEGNVQNLAQGSSGFTQIGNITVNVNKGDIESLKDYLKSVKLSKEDLNELEQAINSTPAPQDQMNFGEKINAWIVKMLMKSYLGAWQINITTAGEVLATAISKFFGFS